MEQVVESSDAPRKTVINKGDVDNKAPETVEAGQTCFGKELKIIKNRGHMGWRIVMEGGGTLPRMFRQVFTQYHLAEDAVAHYHNTKRPS